MGKRIIYFNIPLRQLKEKAESVGIDSAYYFHSFIADSLTEHLVKTEIMGIIRKKLSDSLKLDVSNYTNKKLINMYSAPRLRARMKAQGEVIHQLQNEPTTNLIEEAFDINVEEFAKENSLSIDSVLSLTKRSNQSNPLFLKLMELSKTNYLQICSKEKREEVSEYNTSRYYLYRINDYSFRAAGGYNLD